MQCKKIQSIRLFIAVLLSFTITAGNCLADKVSLEVYGRLPSLEKMNISPDGTHIACIKTIGDERSLLVVRLTDMVAEKQVRIGQNKVRAVEWADDGHILIITSSYERTIGFSGDKSEHLFLQTYDLARNRVVNPLHIKSEEYAFNEINSYPTVRKIKGETVVFVTGWATGGAGHNFKPVLFKFPVDEDHVSIAARSDFDASAEHKQVSWLMNRDGEVVSIRSYDQETREWIIRVRIDGKLKQVAKGYAELEFPRVLGIAPPGDGIWYAELVSSESSGTEEWLIKSISFKDGSIAKVEDEDINTERLTRDSETGQINGSSKRNEENDFRFFDSSKQEIWNKAIHAFEGEYVTFLGSSRDFKKIILIVEGAQHGFSYILYDVEKGQFKSLGKVYDGLKQIATTELVKYKARDGLEISAFMTTPPGRDLKRLPLIIYPHGGPEHHDNGHFDWIAQALAQQGYLVLQPNFRGSDTTQELLAAGYGEWGNKMQTDLSDGIRQLVHEGFVDPRRVCIVGASYGGYAAMAGATLPVDAGIYRCAVSIAGISNLETLVEDKGSSKVHSDSYSGRYFDRYIGATGLKDPRLKERSPIHYVDDVKIPILLIHGKDDTVVKYEQSEQFFNALKKANKNVELVTLKHEDHHLSFSDTRLQMLQATIDFLLQYNPPD